MFKILAIFTLIVLVLNFSTLVYCNKIRSNLSKHNDEHYLRSTIGLRCVRTFDSKVWVECHGAHYLRVACCDLGKTCISKLNPYNKYEDKCVDETKNPSAK